MRLSIRSKLIAYAFFIAFLVGGGISVYSIYIGHERLMRKFEQNDALKADLLATEGAELVHSMPFDSRWGTKKGVPQILAGKPWTGKNMTGVNLDCSIKKHRSNKNR